MTEITKPRPPFANLYEHSGDNSWGSRAALVKTCEFIEQRFGRARCDAEASSDCLRCQTVFLARTMRTLLDDAAREALPDLLAEIAELRERVETVQSALRRIAAGREVRKPDGTTEWAEVEEPSVIAQSALKDSEQ